MRIAVVGAQCTGKSTFIRDLVDYLGSTGREYETPKWTYRDEITASDVGDKINKKTCLDTQMMIMSAIIAEQTTSSGPNVIFDRSPLDAFAYSFWSNRNNPDSDITTEKLNDMADIAVLYMNYDLIFYIPVDDQIGLEDDSLRDTDPEYRKEMDDIFSVIFQPAFHEADDHNWDKYGYKVGVIEGDRDSRIDRASEIIKFTEGKIDAV